jgi:hypothetical protein
MVVRDAALDQVQNPPEHAAAVPLGRERAEPARDENQPRGTGRGAVGMEAWGGREPAQDAGMLTGGVVIHNEAEIPARCRLSVKLVEEPQPLWVPMRGLVRSSRAAKSVGVPSREERQ